MARHGVMVRIIAPVCCLARLTDVRVQSFVDHFLLFPVRHFIRDQHLLLERLIADDLRQGPALLFQFLDDLKRFHA